MEREANNLAVEIDSPDVFGVKCWYSSASLFEKPATTVFFGANPAGDKSSQNLDINSGNLNQPYENLDYNAWLDETWVGNGPKHQRAVASAFQALYGQDWESVLRNTPCFNVLPLRTIKISKVPAQAWADGLLWFKKVIEHLEPSVVICDGNSKSSRSAWKALKHHYSIEQLSEIPTGQKNGAFKEAIITSGRLSGARVLGLPHLSRFGSQKLMEILSSMSSEI